MAQIRFWFDTAQPARSDQTIQQSSALTSVVAAEEDVISLSQTYCTQSPFYRVVIWLCHLLGHRHSNSTAHPIGSGYKRTLHFFDSVALFSTSHSCRDTSSGLLWDSLAASRSTPASPRIASSIVYSSPISCSSAYCCRVGSRQAATWCFSLQFSIVFSALLTPERVMN